MPNPSSLAPVQRWAAHQPLDLEASILECHFVAQFKEETMGTLSGLPCDDYERKLDRVVIQRNGPLGCLDGQGDDLARKAFECLAQVLQDTQQIPYAGPTRVERGSPAPDLSGTHSVPWHKLCVLAQAEEDILDSLIDGNDDRFDRAIYAKFSQSDVFEQHPCDETLFLALRQSHKEDHRAVSCSLPEYYRWYLRSAAHFTPTGEIQGEVRAQAQEMIDAWKDMEPEQQRYWLRRNLGVHPMHQPAFDALLASHRGSSAVAPDRPSRSRRSP